MKLKIKECRQAKGWSIRKLAKETGLSIGNISELENILNKHKNPSLDTICKIAKALEIDPSDLYECE